MTFAEIYKEYVKDSIVFDVVFKHELTTRDFTVGNYFIHTQEGNPVKINSNCYLALLDRTLKRASDRMSPFYSWNDSIGSLFMEGIREHDLTERYGDLVDRIGMLMFLDFREPGEGTRSLLEVFPSIGQNVMLAYIVQKEK